MAMLNNGRRITATGNSDSHHLVFAEPGYPRNFVRLADPPVLAREQDLVEAVRRGRVFVSYGPILDFTANGRGLGELVEPDSNNEVVFEVRVQCASWFTAGGLKLYANGRIVATAETPSLPDAPLDLRWSFVDRPVADTWVLLFVDGEGDLSPIRRGQGFLPLAFTNPIWIDADRDGQFTPPGNFANPLDVAATDAVNANGVPDLLGQWVVLEGCATTDTDFLGPSTGVFYLEDETGGVQVREVLGQLAEVRRGGHVRVGGVLSQVLGETVLAEAIVTQDGPGPPCPSATDFTTGQVVGPGAEPYEGRVVRITGANFTGTWPASGAEGAVSVDDGTGAATLFVPAGIVVPPEAASLQNFTFTALVTQRDFSLPYASSYRLTLRSGADLFGGLIAEGSIAASAGSAARTLQLGPPRPNPFAKTLRFAIDGAIPEGEELTLEVHDVTGRLVQRNVTREGSEIVWDGRDDDGREVGSGVYLARLFGAGIERRHRVVKIR
jgi:hypothetical protein